MSKSVFGGVNISGKRQPGEVWGAYKRRLKGNRILVRRYLYGRLVWDGAWGKASKERMK